MFKSLLTVTLAAAAATASATVLPSTGQYVEHEGIVYDILDFEAKTLGVRGPADECPDFIVFPQTVDVNGQPFTVTQINPDAFANQKYLYFVQFPSSVTDIGADAFNGCQILTFDSLPESLETIGSNAFANCYAVTRIELPAATRQLGRGVFSSMIALKRAILHSDVTVIPEDAFINCTALEEVYMPQQLEEIGDRAFSRTNNLNHIVFPETLRAIGAYAFEGSAGLKVTLPAGLTSLGEGAFYCSRLTVIDLGDSLVEIPENAFSNCYELKVIKFPETLQRIGSKAFYSCGGNRGRSMTDIVVPASVTEIAPDAFDSRMLRFATGDGVEALSAGSCGAPGVIVIGKNVKTIDVNAFSTGSLRAIFCEATVPPRFSAKLDIPAENAQFLSVVVNDDVKSLYEHHAYWKDFNIVGKSESVVAVELDGTKSLAEAIYETSGIMPARVNKLKISGKLTEADLRIIKDNMFSLGTLDIADTDLTIIPSGAFSGMTSLVSIALPKKLTAIGSNAFQNCRMMALSELPDGIETIGDYAFEGCQSITISRLPDALRSTGYSAFSDCLSIPSITAGENLKELGPATFSSCEMMQFADLSKTKITTLKSGTFYCNYYLQGIMLPETLRQLDTQSLSINALETITIPGSVTTLGKEVFYGSKLRAVTLGENIRHINSGTFSGCPKLVAVNLPSTMESLSSNIFSNSYNMSAISCRAIEAPSASAQTFAGIFTQKCTLTVPRQSFASYLSAPGWGMFSKIVNSLEVEIPSNVDATVLPEEDYQDIMESERLKEELEDGDSGETGSEEEETLRQRMRRMRRANASTLASGKEFAHLFNGAVLSSEENKRGKGYRVFIHLREGERLTSVTYNGIDITSSLEGNSILLPNDASGNLVINTTGYEISSGAAAPEVSGDVMCTVYTLTGCPVYRGLRSGIADSVGKGFYVVRSENGASEKIAID